MKKMIPILLLCSTLSAQPLYFPPTDSDDWQQTDPVELGWSNTALHELHTFLDEKNTKAFIMLQDGKIVVELYFDEHSREKFWYWASAGKTVTAFLIGKAQEEGYLSIDDATSKYLGEGWSSLAPEDEAKITICHQLTMTSGLDYRVDDLDCTLPACLQYKADPGMRWAYHNAPYNLLENVLEAATGINKNIYTQMHLGKIGMTGLWISQNYNNLYTSTARSMVRFGLLILNDGVWNGESILQDQNFFQDMTTRSQDLNPSYGYLWWLNGQGKYMLPGLQWQFKTDLIPSAPKDLIAGLGKNDQKVYVVKSQNRVVVRMGDSAGESKYALSSFGNQLWQLISGFQQTSRVQTNVAPQSRVKLLSNYPNPFNNATTISYELAEPANASLKLFNLNGQQIKSINLGFQLPGSHVFKWTVDEKEFSSGIYFYQVQGLGEVDFGSEVGRMVVVK